MEEEELQTLAQSKLCLFVTFFLLSLLDPQGLYHIISHPKSPTCAQLYLKWRVGFFFVIFSEDSAMSLQCSSLALFFFLYCKLAYYGTSFWKMYIQQYEHMCHFLWKWVHPFQKDWLTFISKISILPSQHQTCLFLVVFAFQFYDSSCFLKVSFDFYNASYLSCYMNQFFFSSPHQYCCFSIPCMCSR